MQLYHGRIQSIFFSKLQTQLLRWKRLKAPRIAMIQWQFSIRILICSNENTSLRMPIRCWWWLQIKRNKFNFRIYAMPSNPWHGRSLKWTPHRLALRPLKLAMQCSTLLFTHWGCVGTHWDDPVCIIRFLLPPLSIEFNIMELRQQDHTRLLQDRTSDLLAELIKLNLTNEYHRTLDVVRWWWVIEGERKAGWDHFAYEFTFLNQLVLSEIYAIPIF